MVAASVRHPASQLAKHPAALQTRLARTKISKFSTKRKAASVEAAVYFTEVDSYDTSI